MVLYMSYNWLMTVIILFRRVAMWAVLLVHDYLMLCWWEIVIVVVLWNCLWTKSVSFFTRRRQEIWKFHVIIVLDLLILILVNQWSSLTQSLVLLVKSSKTFSFFWISSFVEFCIWVYVLIWVIVINIFTDLALNFENFFFHFVFIKLSVFLMRMVFNCIIECFT